MKNDWILVAVMVAEVGQEGADDMIRGFYAQQAEMLRARLRVLTAPPPRYTRMGGVRQTSATAFWR